VIKIGAIEIEIGIGSSMEREWLRFVSVWCLLLRSILVTSQLVDVGIEKSFGVANLCLLFFSPFITMYHKRCIYSKLTYCLIHTLCSRDGNLFE
jgi:hypothetical protein